MVRDAEVFRQLKGGGWRTPPVRHFHNHVKCATGIEGFFNRRQQVGIGRENDPHVKIVVKGAGEKVQSELNVNALLTTPAWRPSKGTGNDGHAIATPSAMLTLGGHVPPVVYPRHPSVHANLAQTALTRVARQRLAGGK